MKIAEVKVNGQSVPKMEWKQMNGQTDDGGDSITRHINAVSNKWKNKNEGSWLTQVSLAVDVKMDVSMFFSLVDVISCSVDNAS